MRVKLHKNIMSYSQIYENQMDNIIIAVIQAITATKTPNNRVHDVIKRF
jgi:hypothetical protein